MDIRQAIQGMNVHPRLDFGHAGFDGFTIDQDHAL